MVWTSSVDDVHCTTMNAIRGAGDALGTLALAPHEMSLASISSSMFSLVKSHSTLIESEGFVPRTKICLIGDGVTPTLEAAAESFGLEVVRSATGHEYLDDPSVVLVLEDFTHEKFHRLCKIKWRIIGSVAVIKCANDDLPLPVVERPIFCYTMTGVITCFTGIRDTNLARELMVLVRSMGGSVRKEPNREITHVISMTTKGRKYEYAVTFLVPVMSPEWVRECWKMRFNNAVFATDDTLMAHRLSPFVDVKAAFIGFPHTEYDEMVKTLQAQGGQLVDPSSPMCTHIIADNSSPVTVPASAWREAFVVRAEWFWVSIQQVTRAFESDYPVPPECLRRLPQRGSTVGKENVDPSGSPFKVIRDRKVLRRVSLASVNSPLGTMAVSDWTTPEKTLTPGSPLTPDLFVKRTFPLPSAPPAEDTPPQTSTRRFSSSRHHATPTKPRRLSSPCLNACTTGSQRTPTVAPARRLSISTKGSLDGVAANPISPRFGAFLELLHTEENYVGILDAILQMRVEALNSSQAGGVLLSHTEARMIFGALMPIARTHHAILKDLRAIYNNWSESASVGAVFQAYNRDLLRDYAPFVSSFEDAKETLRQTSERNPRFHAFLKVCRGKPECGRQELHELMIRPVQRLGSCKLLLREILKHTPENSANRTQLESALDGLSHVLSLINEDKRKMEGLSKVFDMYNLIDKCPADLIASHRSLIVECEGVEVSENGFGKQGNHIAFFVFTDVIVVCKKKSKVVAMMKGQPGSNIPQRVLKVVRGKPYKFLQMLPLSTIRKISDITNTEVETNVIGLIFRGKTEVRESCSYFRLSGVSGSAEKAQLIERWSCALANHNCVADPAKFVQRETADEAGIQTTPELFAKQINKAAQMAAKTQVIMTSAFGLGRTQSTVSASSKGSNSSSYTSPPCVMSSFNSTSKLHTLQAQQERLDEVLLGVEEERPKSSSLNANIMKRM